MRFATLLACSLLFASLTSSFAQKAGYLELVGQVLQDSKGLEGTDIKIVKGTENTDNALSASGGKFIFNFWKPQSQIFYDKISSFGPNIILHKFYLDPIH